MRTLLCTLLLGCLALTGCRPTLSPPVVTPTAAPAPAAPPVVAPAAEVPPAATTTTDDGVSLSIASYDELQALIASHKGKVVVVDFWSTQCEPCVKELPHLAAMSHQYPRDKVVCITASLDYDGLPDMPVEKCVDAPLGVLKELKPASINVILKEDSLTILDEKLKLPSMPIVVVYDTDGAVKQTFDESAGTNVSYTEGIQPLVEKMVAERFPTTPKS